MPRVVNSQLLPDLGRMNGRKIISSLAPMTEEAELPPCIHRPHGETQGDVNPEAYLRNTLAGIADGQLSAWDRLRRPAV